MVNIFHGNISDDFFRINSKSIAFLRFLVHIKLPKGKTMPISLLIFITSVGYYRVLNILRINKKQQLCHCYLNFN